MFSFLLHKDFRPSFLKNRHFIATLLLAYILIAFHQSLLLFIRSVSAMFSVTFYSSLKLLLIILCLIIPSQSLDLRRCAVAGATGRTGRLVVEELLRRNISVVALVRDPDKANQVFSKFDASSSSNLEICKCDLTNQQEIVTVMNGVDAALWCATGFSDAPNVNFLEKMKRMLMGAIAPKRSIDAVGIPVVAECLLRANHKKSMERGASSENDLATAGMLPKLVMLSSAGVTRPAWDESKKEKFRGCADIPIVRLNPFGILDVKRQSEDALRQSGVPYCVVRPGGLNDNWPAGSRPIFSQGDVAVGRMNRKDVADVLVDVLTTPEATGKTFELIAAQGYPKAVSIGPALARLSLDTDGPLSMDAIAATYSAMQQLLPGEQQDSAALAMGQTYEELDSGTTGAFGVRGQEAAEAVAPKPSL
jgi:uncharacterized protein YbjT (DUF2867 family)